MHSEGRERKEAFRALVRLLAVHETAKEEIVHPMARPCPAATGSWTTAWPNNAGPIQRADGRVDLASAALQQLGGLGLQGPH